MTRSVTSTMSATTSTPTGLTSRASSWSKCRAVPWRRVVHLVLAFSTCPSLLDLPIHSSCHPNQPDHTSHDAIHNLTSSGVGLIGAGQHEAKTAINDGKGDDNAAEPDMDV